MPGHRNSAFRSSRLWLAAFGIALLVFSLLTFRQSATVDRDNALSTGFISTDLQALPRAANYIDEFSPYSESPHDTLHYSNVVTVVNANELRSAVYEANRSGGNIKVLLADGIYPLRDTLNIIADRIALHSSSDNPEKVILQGSKHKNRGPGNLIRVSGSFFSIQGITLQNADFHLIQIAGEEDADFPIIRNCILQDAFQQLVKISYNPNPALSSDFGIVEQSVFRYTDGIGPNWYIGGIDLHAGNGWIIRDNKFQDIASPAGQISEHAIHVWNNAANTVVENNTILNSDRGIGFGMKTDEHPALIYSHRGGLISNNLIVHTDSSDDFADVGIILEDSAGTIVKDNLIWQGHAYPNAIEYRYASSHSIVIIGNRTNKAIRSRDGGQARLIENHKITSLEELMEHINDNGVPTVD